MVKAYPWLLAAHLIGVVLWVGAITAIYWMLRLHDHAPKEMHEKLTLMERALALSADFAVTVAIGCGLVMAFGGPDHAGTWNWFSAPGNRGWLHLKLTVVVLALLSVHGILRGRIKRFGQGDIKPVPGWLWTTFLAGLTVAIIAATTKFQG
jgi:uncharacterized membrane protein